MAPLLEFNKNNAKSSVDSSLMKTNPVSAWQQPSPSARDFRSDVTTTSTTSMLQAIVNAGLNDGWTSSGATAFEAHVARLAGRSNALYSVSSIMSNQVALRTHATRPPTGIICDARSHIIHMEAGGVASWAGAMPVTLMPSNGLFLTLEDIQRKTVLSDGSDSCTCPTRIIHLENPLGGIIMPLDELRRIKRFAEAHGLKVHMDGARLWEAIVAGAGALDEFCGEADSVNLCLTKGLGAPVGSILLGDHEFIRAAKWVRKSVGGAMRQPGLMAAAAWAAMDEAFGHHPSGRGSFLPKSHEQAKQVADYWVSMGKKLVVPQQTNMIWLDLKDAGIDEVEWENIGDRYGIKLHSSRLVIHYQISDEAVSILMGMMRDVVMENAGKTPILDPVPRNEAVSRVAADMEEAMTAVAWRRTYPPITPFLFE